LPISALSSLDFAQKMAFAKKSAVCPKYLLGGVKKTIRAPSGVRLPNSSQLSRSSATFWVETPFAQKLHVYKHFSGKAGAHSKMGAGKYVILYSKANAL
jgi:hypothetical protein